MPEMYDYAREALIPKPATFVPAAQWNAFSQILSYSADGRMNSVVSRLLDMAASQGKLDELARAGRRRAQGDCPAGRPAT